MAGDHAIVYGIYRMRGHFDGRTISGVEWVKARGEKPPNYPSGNVPIDEWTGRTGPVFVVEDWCFLATEMARENYPKDVEMLRRDGVPFCGSDGLTK